MATAGDVRPMIRMSINGARFEFPPGLSILEAARRAGVIIPTVCRDPRLEAIGSCRLCSVEIVGKPRTKSACKAPIRNGMRVITHSDALEGFRTQMLTWMAEKVSLHAFEAYPDKELHRLMRQYGVMPGGSRRRAKADLSNPYIRVDMSQCIDCYRCVHICDELQGQSVWHALGRGEDTRIVPDIGDTLAESSCVTCGACADTCPTGALTDRCAAPALEQWTRTTCVYCGVGCEMEAASVNGRITQVRPVLDAPVSKGHLCVKGRYAFNYTNAPDRQTMPLRRAGRGWQETSWEEALDLAAKALTRTLAAHGPSSIGVLGSARATNEDNYLAQKFARVVLGTNNVDCCARVCHTPSAAALKTMLGTGAATNSLDDIERARTILVFGANPTECHPVVGARIKQQVLRGGANLVVVDPRKTELARLAAVHLALKPGTNIPLLNALAHVIVTEELADRDFIARRVREWDEFRAFVANWPPERAADICGVAAEDIRRAARLYATAAPAMSVHGLGVTEHLQGTEGVMGLVNLALVTGNIGKPGSGVNPLRGQNNVQGAAQMGCDPSILTGSVAIEERRTLFERVWNASVPRDHGLNLMAMMDAAAAGRLKALWVIGYDILPTLANMSSSKAALKALDFVIVQDLFITRTAAAAGHLFLPAASNFEKDGTFMNGERRIQRVRKAAEAPGSARPDWWIISELAKRMGHGAAFPYSSAEDIWNEIRLVWPEAAGVTYARLEQGGLQWPCRTEDDPGTTILHVSDFSRPGRAALQRLDYVATPERTSEQFPLLLSTGRNLFQFNAGTMTMRTRNAELRRTDTLDLSPFDAERLGVSSGARVRVRSHHGSVVMEARVTDAIRPGTAFATFHDPRVGLNKITSAVRDRIVQAPEYKVTAVAVEPA